ncbi:hypothetical protein [Arthrobacter sp. CAN_A1]|uniref:hypothetical protein n=1 Tax=Arthrobacter sp. CAN_A1 TaxID=2787717 RepID=UPI0018CB4C63
MDFSLTIAAGHVNACPMTPRHSPQSSPGDTYCAVADASRYPVTGMAADAETRHKISAGHGHPAATRSSHISIENE